MRLAVPIILGLTLALSNPASAAVVKDHPAVTAYPESVATRRDDDGFRITSSPALMRKARPTMTFFRP